MCIKKRLYSLLFQVAITNSRIEEVTTDEVIINYKQYALKKKGQPPPIGTREFGGSYFVNPIHPKT